MDIACPNCAATYRVPESLLAHGKALRCAACGEEWVPLLPAGADALPLERQAFAPLPPAVEEGAPLLAAPASAITETVMAEALVADVAPPPVMVAARPPPPTTPPPLQRRNSLGSRPVPSARPRPGRLLPLAWLASVACVLLALAGLVIFGDSIAAAWPPFARVTMLTGG